MKKRIASIILTIAVFISFMPFFTVQAEAFSTGSKTLVKTRTVTIKAGKTYKSPTFKLSKKMMLQVPVKMKPSKIKNTDYNFKLKYKMTLKSANGKTKGSYTCPATYIYDFYTDEILYDQWIYFNNNESVKNPCYAKGKYYITIKNTTKRSIKVTYSVKGYTKYAEKAEFKKTISSDYDGGKIKVGKVGPGLPLIKNLKSSNPDIEVYWYMTPGGVFSIAPYNDSGEAAEATLTVTLKSNKKYKFKLKMKPNPNEIEEETEDDE